MYYHLQFASETSEAKLFVQGHPAELGFEPGPFKAHVLTTTHLLPRDASKQTWQGHCHCGPRATHPLPSPWLVCFTLQSVCCGVGQSFMAGELQEKDSPRINPTPRPSAFCLHKERSFRQSDMWHWILEYFRSQLFGWIALWKFSVVC